MKENGTLAERRETVVAYMRQMATVMWRAGEDITYTIATGTHPDQASNNKLLRIVKGRLYQGIPYSYAGSTADGFLAYASGKEGEIPVVTGLTWENLSGGAADGARIGNDCSTAIMHSWSRIGASIDVTNTRYMARSKGYLRVGEYVSDDADITNSPETCLANGTDVMFEAYAKLQKADAVVMRNASAGHTMLVVNVCAMRNEDGSLDGRQSTVTVIEQTRGHLQNEKYYISEVYGEKIYITYGIDVDYTFQDLFAKGYLPVTCKELIDPAPVEAPAFWDTVAEHNAENLLKGVISSSWLIDRVTVRIENETGVVQEGYTHPGRRSNRTLDLAYFAEGKPFSIVGAIAPGELRSGKYHCAVICRLTTGEDYTVRDFDFEV